MSDTLVVDLKLLKKMIGKCNLEEKIELIRYLENDTCESRFRSLLKHGVSSINEGRDHRRSRNCKAKAL